MPRIFEGKFDASELRVAIVVSRFNNFVSEKLLEGALDALVRHGANEDAVEIFRIPGAFEIPATCKKLALTKKYSAIICLGALIRGGTQHFDLIAAEVFKGVAAVSMDYLVSIGMGVITAENLEQAIERCGSKMGNKGFDAAQSAIEMANLNRQIEVDA